MKTIFNLHFVKIGSFYLAKIPWVGKNKQWGDWVVNSKFEPVNNKVLKADENVYLVIVNDVITYVGEYIYNLEDRWFKNSNGYVNHHTWKEIDEALEQGKDVSLWLCHNPFIALPDGSELNIAKSLEQKIIDEFSPEWNKKSNRSKWLEWRKKNCIRINDIISCNDLG